MGGLTEIQLLFYITYRHDWNDFATIATEMNKSIDIGREDNVVAIETCRAAFLKERTSLIAALNLFENTLVSLTI